MKLYNELKLGELKIGAEFHYLGVKHVIVAHKDEYIMTETVPADGYNRYFTKETYVDDLLFDILYN
tara:strand:+ start:532 stop:729 length:198 start_codon:yes stop_codon:yes gene_type:complete